VSGLQNRQAKGRVVILGGGFAGSYVARLGGKTGATILLGHPRGLHDG
jgi:NADH dehydrogenase FAD-containing subunit